jgi:hypothetical protein
MQCALQMQMQAGGRRFNAGHISKELKEALIFIVGHLSSWQMD